MKRTVGALLLLGGLGGCMSPGGKPDAGHFNRVGYGTQLSGFVGPDGEPVHASRAFGGSGERRGLITDMLGVEDKPAPKARGAEPSESGVRPAAYAAKADPKAKGKVDPNIKQVNGIVPGPPPAAVMGPPPGPFSGPGGPGGPGMANPFGAGGRPALGPPGAVAAVGALPVGMGLPQTGLRTEVRFANPPGMKVQWFGPPEEGGKRVLETPGRYNFLQGGTYRLKLSDIANRPGLELYPTLQVYPCTQKSSTFLAHSAVPVAFTDEDFEQVVNGNLVVKVIYLPDPQFQDLAVAGPDEVVSTRLEPGVDPILEANRRGTILLIVRIGNIDLEAPGTPAMNAPPGPLGQGPPGPGMIPAPGLAARPPVPAAPVALPSPPTPPPPTAGRASISALPEPPSAAGPSAPALLPNPGQ